ncbi:MAG: hypothetical protein WB565_10990 [Acidimicrobiales bacterium]
MRQIRPLVYAAHPVTTYGTELERMAIKRIARLAREAEVINPATRYVDGAHREADWPRLVEGLSAVVVFGDEDCAIGAGCLKGLADAWRCTGRAARPPGGDPPRGRTDDRP